jgi:hypothetical protein
MPPNGPPPFPDGPVPDWARDTPRPTSPPPPRRRQPVPQGYKPAPHYLDDSDDGFVRDGLRALRRAVQDFRLAGMSNAEIERALSVLLRDSWGEATQ